METQKLEQRIRSLGEAIRQQEDFYRSTNHFLHQVYRVNSLSDRILPSAKQVRAWQTRYPVYYVGRELRWIAYRAIVHNWSAR